MLTIAGLHLYVIEHDERLRTQLVRYFQMYGCHVTSFASWNEAVERVLDSAPDVVILDVDEPGLSGIDVCRDLRSQYEGLIVLLASKADPYDELLALELGADEYLMKPVAFRFILARINVYLRRMNTSQDKNIMGLSRDKVSGSEVLNFGFLSINIGKRQVIISGNSIDFTDAEFDVLVLLASKSGKIISRSAILNDTRGIDYDGFNRSVDAKIVKIRKKLSSVGVPSDIIKSVRGKGYLFQQM